MTCPIPLHSPLSSQGVLGQYLHWVEFSSWANQLEGGMHWSDKFIILNCKQNN